MGVGVIADDEIFHSSCASARQLWRAVRPFIQAVRLVALVSGSYPVDHRRVKGARRSMERKLSARRPETDFRRHGYRFLFVCWTVLCLFSYAHYRILTGVEENAVLGVLKFLTCYYPWLLLTPLLFRLERRYPLRGHNSIRHGALLALLALPICYATSLLALGTLPALGIVFMPLFESQPFSWAVRLTELELQLILYSVTVGASAFLRHLEEVRQTESLAAELALQTSELQSALRQAELETLRMRLNPHFLFNCLQSISSLAGKDSGAASTMLARLGDLLRVALRSDYTAEITLQEEIGLTQAYASIEQIRYGSRLSVIFDVEDYSKRAYVPSMLLQPLVENSIKHGLARQESGVVWIRSSLEDQQVVLTVRDNGVGLTVDNPADLRFGIGLGATKDRLLRMYGEKHSFLIRALPEGGTEVRVVLPLRTAGQIVAVGVVERACSKDSRSSVEEQV